MRAVVAAVIGLTLCTTPAVAQLENVGNLIVPDVGFAEAQKHFLRGVAILHSFGWKQAMEEFQAAQKLQPDFAMAYWGESPRYNHLRSPPAGSEEPTRRTRAARAEHRCTPGQGPDGA